MQFDSTYSALKALNEALGGTQQNPDSEYSAVINLMSTLNGAPVEAASAFEAVSDIAVAAENGELPIQSGEGCNHKFGDIGLTANGTYMASDYGYSGFREVSVSVPTGADQIPSFKIIDYDSELKLGDVGKIRYIRKSTSDVPWIESKAGVQIISEYAPQYDENGDAVIVEDHWVEAIEFIVTSEENPFIYIKDIGFRASNVDGVDVNCRLNIETWISISVLEGGSIIDAEHEDWQISEGSGGYFDQIDDENYIDLTVWGDPMNDSNVVVCNTLKEFVEAEGYDENQWFEITGTVQGQQQCESGCVKLVDDSLFDSGGNPVTNNGYVVINYTNRTLGVPTHYGSWENRIYEDGVVCKIRTLRHKKDITTLCKNEAVQAGVVFGGHIPHTPAAILIDDNINE